MQNKPNAHNKRRNRSFQKKSLQLSSNHLPKDIVQGILNKIKQINYVDLFHNQY